MENISKMLGLVDSGFLEQNVVTLSEDVLVQKFISTPTQVQLAFV
jgi:hypothetical protein